MNNPTPATTTADTPRSSERLKHSADVGGGETKAAEREGGSVRKPSLTAFALPLLQKRQIPTAGRHRTRLWGNAQRKAKDYRPAAAAGPIRDTATGPGDGLPRSRRRGAGPILGGKERFRVMLHLATGRRPSGAASRGLKATHTEIYVSKRTDPSSRSSSASSPLWDSQSQQDQG